MNDHDATARAAIGWILGWCVTLTLALLGIGICLGNGCDRELKFERETRRRLDRLESPGSIGSGIRPLGEPKLIPLETP